MQLVEQRTTQEVNKKKGRYQMKKIIHYDDPATDVKLDDLDGVTKETLENFKGNKGEEGT